MKQLFTFSYLCLTLLVSTLHGMQPPVLVSDDINSPTRWVENPSNPAPVEIPEEYLKVPVELPLSSRIAIRIKTMDVSRNLFSIPLYIRKRQFYRPQNVNNPEDLIAVFFTHGTFGKDTEHFHEDQNTKKQNYRHLKRFATWYATIKHKNLELLSCKWSGDWNDRERQKAAAKLSSLIHTCYKNAEKILVAHSHGCNIHNLITLHENAQKKPIDLMIHLACPRKKAIHYQPVHYKTLLYFFSEGDWTAIAGRADEDEVLETIAITAVGTAATVISSCVNPIAGAVVAVATTSYLGTQVVKLIDGTNDFLNHDGKITAGFSTKINSWNPWHSQIVDITKHLPEIIEKVLTEYPYYYAKSNGFYLNINNKKNNNNPLHIVLRKKILNDLSSPSMPQTIDYLVRNNNVNNIIKPRSFLSLDSEDTEKEHSTHEAIRYKECYNWEITQSGIRDIGIPTTHDKEHEKKLSDTIKAYDKNFDETILNKFRNL